MNQPKPGLDFKTYSLDSGGRYAMATPDASAAIHECVLAIKTHVTVDVLAETIHAFPSTSRIFNGLFADARRKLDGGGDDGDTKPDRPG